MPVAFDPHARLWLLSGPATAYAVRHDAELGLRHVHWGAPITPAEAKALAPGDYVVELSVTRGEKTAQQWLALRVVR